MRFSIGVAQDQNKAYRDHMEDTYAVHADVGGRLFAAVFDGHNGNEAACLARERLHTMPPLTDETLHPDVRLVQSFELFDAILMEQQQTAGSTAVMLLLAENGECLVAWAGDSSVFIADNKGFRLVTPPHGMHDPNEQKRVLSAGGEEYAGYVKQPDSMRVLGMTRAFGDYPFKKIGVIASPSIRNFTYAPGMRILLCSDGVLSMRRPRQYQLANVLMRGRTAQEAANLVVSTAKQHWDSDDNLTALVIEAEA
jgi:serine/threonine protein phosphatase PrpC